MSASVGRAWSRYLERDVDGALEELLAVWAKKRNASLADLIELVMAARPREPLAGQTGADLRRVWERVAAEGSHYDLPRLLDALTRMSLPDACEALETLVERPPNPHISNRLHALLMEPPPSHQRKDHEPFWDLVLAVIARSADPRIRQPLSNLAARLCEQKTRSRDYDVRVHLLSRLSALLTSLDTLSTTLSGTEYAAVSRLARRIRNPSRGKVRPIDELLERIYADPSDDELRMVLADALSDLGSPRGEFIVIQMQAAREGSISEDMRRREQQLFEQHARTWLGPLKSAFRKKGIIYRRGFPAVGQLVNVTDPRMVGLDPSLLVRPEWTTFEELDVRYVTNPSELILRPDLTALRSVTGMTDDIFLAEHELPIERLGLRLAAFSDSELVARCRVLPHLRHLELYWSARAANPSTVRPLWAAGALGRQLETLTVRWDPAWLVECGRAPPPVERVILADHIGAWSGVLTPDEHGRFTGLTLTPPAGPLDWDDKRWDVETFLSNATIVTLTLRRMQAADGEQRLSLTDFFRRHSGVENVEFTDD